MLLLLIVFGCAVSLTSSQNWTTYGDQEYFFGRTITTFAASTQACSNMSAHLVVIPNITIQTFLEETIRHLQGYAPGSFWIGLVRNSTTKEFDWVDSTPFIRDNFENFHFQNGRLDHYTQEECVTIGLSSVTIGLSVSSDPFQWFDITCHGTLSSYICQRSVSSSTVTPLSTSDSGAGGTNARSTAMTVILSVVACVVLVVLFCVTGITICKIRQRRSQSKAETQLNEIYRETPANGNAPVYEEAGEAKLKTEIPGNAIEHSSNVRPTAEMEDENAAYSFIDERYSAVDEKGFSNPAYTTLHVESGVSNITASSHYDNLNLNCQ